MHDQINDHIIHLVPINKSFKSFSKLEGVLSSKEYIVVELINFTTMYSFEFKPTSSF